MKIFVFLLMIAIPAMAQDHKAEDYTELCPCPYSYDSKGQFCGNKSVWVKSHGQYPQC